MFADGWTVEFDSKFLVAVAIYEQILEFDSNCLLSMILGG